MKKSGAVLFRYHSISVGINENLCQAILKTGKMLFADTLQQSVGNYNQVIV
jgi:hypothetical protein